MRKSLTVFTILVGLSFSSLAADWPFKLKNKKNSKVKTECCKKTCDKVVKTTCVDREKTACVK